MKPCEHFRPHLVELAYDELSADQADALQEHLASCAACRETFQALRGAQEALSAWSHEPSALVAAPVTAATIVARSQWREQQQRVQRRRRVTMLAACAAAIAIGLGLGFRIEWDARHVALVWAARQEVVTAPLPDTSYAHLRQMLTDNRPGAAPAAWPQDLARAPSNAASYSQLRRELDDL